MVAAAQLTDEPPRGGADDESAFALAAQLIRRHSPLQLALVAFVAAAAACAAVVAARYAWPSIGLATALWAAAGWGLADRRSPSTAKRIAQLTFAVIATAAAAGLGVAFFYWLLGPRWML